MIYSDEENIIYSSRRCSSAGQSVRFTSERSWVRAPTSPPTKRHAIACFFVDRKGLEKEGAHKVCGRKRLRGSVFRRRGRVERDSVRSEPQHLHQQKRYAFAYLFCWWRLPHFMKPFAAFCCAAFCASLSACSAARCAVATSLII